MLKINNLSFSFPDKDLYDNISFTIENGDCCAFIGTSGCGKSTLAQMIMDTEKYMYDGDILFDEPVKVSKIHQFYEFDHTNETTVFDYIAEEFIRLQNRITDICTEMETAEDLDSLLEEYQEVLDEFTAIDGDNYENNINRKLNLANLFDRKDLAVAKLSGGEFKLIQVIKTMLTNPHFIIMDEPDAFLDFENINALRNLINNHKGTLLVITHSRYLLNHCFNRIIHLENKQLQEFEGKYIDYNFELLANKIELQELAFKDDEEIKRNNILIDRYRTIATNIDSKANGRALQARVKIGERLEARRIKTPFICIEQPNVNFIAENVNEEITPVKVTNLNIAFDEDLLNDVNFEIGYNDKVAIIGANGTGKTTLLRAIHENKNPAIEIDESIEISYLSQVQNEMLKECNTIYDEFFDIGFETYDDINDYLATFGFPAERMEQKISALSGGEKNIIQLAKISSKRANMLILDEPTSHLDTYSQVALENAINNYNGAILMVSHDFYFIANFMDYILIIEDKTVRKMSCRKFRKMIYAKHFNKEYLMFEQNKKMIEMKIEHALAKSDFETAKVLAEDLAKVIGEM